MIFEFDMGAIMTDRQAGPGAMEHQFAIGQRVRLTTRVRYLLVAKGFFEVRRQLPKRDGKLQYQLRSANEAYERVLNENELEAV